MKKKLFSLSLLCIAVSAFAQQDFFALSGKEVPAIVFNDLRTLDVDRGVSGEVFLNSESQPKIFSEVRNMQVTEEKNSYNNALAKSMATLAFDGKSKLIYMPLYSTNIYALDTKTKEITLIESTVVKTSACDLGSHFTRMTTGTDGRIYAMTNSGSQLIQISNKAGKYVVKDLGKISDDAANGENLLSKMEIGFGGDMIADTDNNLYVFSASGNVFKIDFGDQKAVYLGKVKNLPQNYTLNGVAVNSHNEIVVGSAKGGNFYKVNLENWIAEITGSNLNLHIYDLASKYQLEAKPGNLANANNSEIYPTKIEDGFVNVRFGKEAIGNCVVEIYDMTGKNLSTTTYNSKVLVVEKMDINFLTKGVYVVKIKNGDGKTLITKKLLVAK